jgi:hypothetical protein
MFNNIKKSEDSFGYFFAVGHLLAYLSKLVDLSQEFYDTIHSMLKPETLASKLQVADVGEICKTAYWIETGYARFFKEESDPDNGVYEDTIGFCRSQRILVIPECFFNGDPCGYGVELAEGSVVVPFSGTHFDLLKLSAPEAETLANKILSLHLLEGLEKARLMKMKPRRRYREFLNIFGKEIEQFYAVKQIASYLGMNPAFLSRLRSEIKKKKRAK